MLGAHEGEGLLVEHDAAVSVCLGGLPGRVAVTLKAPAMAAWCCGMVHVQCQAECQPRHSAIWVVHLPQVAGSRSADTKGQRADHRIVEVGGGVAAALQVTVGMCGIAWGMATALLMSGDKQMPVPFFPA